MKITIKLLSDLCTCSGETYNSVVDMDVVYDENGIPYIPAKRIKGCIREAALEMKEMGFISEAQYESVFGKEGNTKSKLILSSAYIQDYENIVKTNYPAFTVPRGFKCRNNREINDTHTNLTTSIYCSKPSSITSPVESKRTELRALR